MVVNRFPNVGLYFRFYGDVFDPDEVTRRLKIQPTSSFRLGDPITEDGEARWPSNGWIIEVGPRSVLDIEDMLHELQAKVSTLPNDVRRVCGDLKLDLVIICGVSGEQADALPTMFFPADFLAWVAEMGASLNVDAAI